MAPEPRPGGGGGSWVGAAGTLLLVDLRPALFQLGTRCFDFSAAASASAFCFSSASRFASSGDIVIPDMKSRNRSPYCSGGKAEICVRSLESPFQKCSIFLMTPY